MVKNAKKNGISRVQTLAKAIHGDDEQFLAQLKSK